MTRGANAGAMDISSPTGAMLGGTPAHQAYRILRLDFTVTPIALHPSLTYAPCTLAFRHRRKLL